MKTNITDNIYSFFILGLPRSGTTIVSNFMHSLEDCVCLNEPHWLAENSQKNFSFWEWYYSEEHSKKRFLSGYKNHLLGYKETYRPGHPLCEKLIKRDIGGIDFFIIVLRDPVVVHSSQHALGWTEWDDPYYFTQSYMRLDRLTSEYRCKCSVVVYEDFVKNPVEYMRKKVRKLENMTGELVLKPRDSKFGDPLANRSTKIVPSQREICIPDDWIRQHEEGRKIWQKYRT